MGVLLLGIGVVNLASGVGTTAESAAGLFSRAGVEVAKFKRGGRLWRLPGALKEDRLTKGDLKGFRGVFPLIFETEGVRNEEFPSAALGVEE